MRPPNEYDRVADLYDTHVHVDFDLPFWIQEASSAGEVLELMAGTGRVALPLAASGARVICVDAAAAMLDQLRKKLTARGLSADVVHQDVRELSLRRQFALAILPFNSFAEITGARERQDVLQRVHHHLVPGGRFICTLRNPGVRRRKPEGQLQVSGTDAIGEDGRRLIFSVAEFPTEEPGVIEAKQFYELYDREGRLVGKRLLELRFALIERIEFERMAVRAGFAVQSLYGDYDRRPFDAATSPYLIWSLIHASAIGGVDHKI